MTMHEAFTDFNSTGGHMKAFRSFLCAYVFAATRSLNARRYAKRRDGDHERATNVISARSERPMVKLTSCRDARSTEREAHSGVTFVSTRPFIEGEDLHAL
jgi:hypothetical protein